MRRLPSQTVQRIRAEAAAGVPVAVLARRYGCSIQGAANVVRSVTRRDVPLLDDVESQSLLDGFASAALLHELQQAAAFAERCRFHLRNAVLSPAPADLLESISPCGGSAGELCKSLATMLRRFDRLIDLEARKGEK